MTNLKPANRYVYKIQSTAKTKSSKLYRFVSMPIEGKMQLLSLDVITAIYLKTNLDGKSFELPREKLGDKVQKEFEKARLFYLRNSNFKLNLKINYIVVDDRIAKVEDGWIEPDDVRRDLKELLTKQDRNLEYYDSIIAVYAEPGYNASTKDDIGVVGGGGMTPFGYSVFGVGGKLAWLFMHEYHHQIDKFFERSGMPEYWLNHPDDTTCTGRYGDHWDFNAYILRNWPTVDWLACDFGKIIETDDRDEDGIPDSDARLALDETRFGSDRMKADTDSDGLSDLQEAMAGIFSGSDPTNADTDGDGVTDGKDSYPLYALKMVREKKVPTLNGKIELGEWQELYPFKAHSITGKTYMEWSDGFIYFAVVSDSPLAIDLKIDPDDDGYFTGPLIPTKIAAPKPDAKCEVNGLKDTEVVSKVSNGETVVEIKIPVLRLGDRFGIQAIFSDKDDACHLFEPWTLTSFTLAE